MMEWQIKLNPSSNSYSIEEYRGDEIYGPIMCNLTRELAIHIVAELRRVYWSGKYEIAAKHNLDLREFIQFN